MRKGVNSYSYSSGDKFKEIIPSGGKNKTHKNKSHKKKLKVFQVRVRRTQQRTS
jgi:hypothetical protein